MVYTDLLIVIDLSLLYFLEVSVLDVVILRSLLLRTASLLVVEGTLLLLVSTWLRTSLSASTLIHLLRGSLPSGIEGVDGVVDSSDVTTLVGILQLLTSPLL